MTRGLLTGIALGVGAMFLLDPGRGRRRRAMVRDRVLSGANRLKREIERGKEDMANRTQGLRAKSRQLVDRAMHREQTTDDDILVSRVRSAIGHAIHKPHDVEVTAESGKVMLRGSVYQDEIAGLNRRVRSVAGVDQVADELEIRAENAPPGDPAEATPKTARWSPAWRLAAMAGGGALTLYGMKKRGLIGTAGASLGGTLVSRAMNR